ncbi:MAG: peptidylprolyl isomerase [Alphaproteobacteria bacterium]|nr:peptidylprolyl isomerase [Alphaproteobacteria bacterium SS10]
MLTLNRLSLIALLFSLALLTTPVKASAQVEGIAAVVNDDIISLSDLRDRLTIAIVSAGLEDNEEIRRRLQEQVLQTLIDEQLKRQEAIRLELPISDEEIEEELGLMAQRNNMETEQFQSMLAGRGVPLTSLREQVGSDVAWRKVINARLRRQVTISEDDVSMRKQQLRQQQGQIAYGVQEIFLPVENPAQDEAVRSLAIRLVEQIRRGAPFAAVAAQFSQGLGAQQGGNLGWIQPGQLAPEIDVVLPRIGVNRISPPIRTEEGYHLIAVRRVREAANAAAAKLSLKQLIVEPSEELSGESLVAEAANIAAGIDSCDAMQAVIDASPSSLSGDMGQVAVGDLNPVFQNVVNGLETGQISAPLPLGDFVALIMVCDREEGEISLPDDETIRGDIGLERLDLLQQRYLRDLRTAAFIDERL